MGGTCRLRVSICPSLLVEASPSTGGDGGGGAATSLTPASDDGSTPNSAGLPPLQSVSQSWPSDATIREMVESSLEFSGRTPITRIRILDLLELQQARLWDCTLYPPMEITDWPLVSFPDHVGLRSKTLFDAGWFPTGTLQVLPYHAIGPRLAAPEQYDDLQYNRPSVGLGMEGGETTTKPQVQWIGAVTNPHDGVSTNTRLLPSQLLQSVTDRWGAGETNNNNDNEAARALELRNQQLERRRAAAVRQRQRWDKLESRIQQLHDNAAAASASSARGSRNRIVSQQVERMLIKSRATGRSDLKLQDRFYLSFVVDRGPNDDPLLEHRYVSPQDTVGRLLEAFPCPAEWTSELLVRTTRSEGDRDGECRRLPTLWRVYELVAEGVVAEFDRLVVRWYDPTCEEPSTSLQDDLESAAAASADGDVDSMIPNNSQPLDGAASALQVLTDQPIEPLSETVGLDRPLELPPGPSVLEVHPAVGPILLRALQLYDNDSKASSSHRRTTKGAAKASSAAAVKVRQMQLKSKARGDVKRVLLPDRFFLELVTMVVLVSDAAETTTTPSVSGVAACDSPQPPPPCSVSVQSCTPIFLSKCDPFERLIRDCVKRPDPAKDWMVSLWVVPSSGSGGDLQLIPDHSMALQEAERQHLIQGFDRLIAYVHSKTNV